MTVYKTRRASAKNLLRPAAALLLLLALTALCSCAVDIDYLAYQRDACVVSARYTSGGVEYEAEITLGSSPAADENIGGGAGDIDMRDMRIDFVSPAGLEGVSVYLGAGSASLRSGGVCIPLSPEAAAGFFPVCRLFCIDGAGLRSSEHASMCGRDINVLTLSDDDGSYTIYLDTQSLLPVRIEAVLGSGASENAIKLDVLSIKK